MGEVRDFDSLLINHVGEFGRYQKFVFVSLSLVAVGVVIQNLLHVFTGAEVNHVCLNGDDLDGQNLYSNDERGQFIKGNITQWKIDLYAGLANKSLVGEHVKCHFYSFDNVTFKEDNYHGDLGPQDYYQFPKPISKSCDQWIYDTTQYKSSIVTQWDLVCDRAWLASLTQSLHFVGCLIGALLCGYLSDRFGRRNILLITTFVQITVAIATAFVPIFEIYATLRLVIGIASAGQFNCAYIIAIELVGPRWRNVAAIFMFYFNSIGILLLALCAFLVRDWWILQIVVSAPLVLLLSYYWIAPESPRWLIAHGRCEEASKLLRKMAKWNRTSLPPSYANYLQIQEKEEPIKEAEHSYNIIDLLRCSRLRSRTVVLCFAWFSNSTTYYGLSLNTSKLGGDDYLKFFLSGLVELPAYTFCIWSLNRLGRKYPLLVSMIVGGAALLTTIPLADDMNVVRITLCMVGKLAISISYCSIYPFTVELFPTVVRNSGLGLCSMFARVAGFVAPYVLFLGTVDKALPLVVMGALSAAGGLLCLLLPETLGKPLPESIEDLDDITCVGHCIRSRRMRNNELRQNCKHQPDSIALGEKSSQPFLSSGQEKELREDAIQT